MHKEYALTANGINFNAENIEKAFLEGIEFAQRWINVADELPKQGDLVLIKTYYGDVSTARYNECLKLKFAIDFLEICSKDVKFWRPI
ncbi:hypothetical protein FACS189434_06660 [Bacteroidia bacterium]|nr:hypothetical protein FACS189434_06660 [Bacteroidia bacterium]